MEISALFGKEKTFTIAGQELRLRPLELADANLFVQMEKEDKRGDAIKELIAISLKRSYPDIKDEDIDKISMEHLEELIKAIAEVNNFDTKELKK
jgi:hypothetical protein